MVCGMSSQSLKNCYEQGITEYFFHLKVNDLNEAAKIAKINREIDEALYGNPLAEEQIVGNYNLTK